MINKFLSRRLVRYILVGGLSYAVELSILISLHTFLHLSAVQATAIAFWFGFALSFIFQKLFTFSNYQKEVKTISKQIVLYSLLVIFNYTFTLIFVSLFSAKVIIISRTVALLITTIWNYFIYRIIFKHKWQNRFLKRLNLKIVGLVKNQRVTRKKILVGILLTLPLILFFYQYLSTPNKIIPGDFDYYAQLYEAFRISVLKFHQIPLWNPWMSGGVPLFANPQFGLFSLQSLLVLPFGAMYGLKLAYVCYAIAGFWGMHIICRRIFKASALRSVLISYIWIFSGFFAGHNISHFTTTTFFLLPWLIYWLINRSSRFGWLWLGLTTSIIISSGIDFVLLMELLILGCLFIFSTSNFSIKKPGRFFSWNISKKDIYFILKALLVIFVLCGYRFILTYIFVSANPRPAALLLETPLNFSVIFSALFLPIATLLKTPSHLQWGWGEYSMYMGLGVSIIFFVCIVTVLSKTIRGKFRQNNFNNKIVWSFILIGFLGFLFAFGDFSKFSPYHILRSLPGYSQTRVSARWLFLAQFAILSLIASWKNNKKLVNTLLLLSVIELFISYGPPRINGSNQVNIPTSQFASTFTEYDNNKKHLISSHNLLGSYYYSTANNIGQVYTDEPFADTLDAVIGTTKCGLNKNPLCQLVLTGNAVVKYWSPNKIIIDRTKAGDINLNMNLSNGWQINSAYPYANSERTDPSVIFNLPGAQKEYTMIYAPKLSPQWVIWRLGL